MDLEPAEEKSTPPDELARRDFVRGAGAVGAIVWATPVIRTVSLVGAEAGSPPPSTTSTTTTTTSLSGQPTTTGRSGATTTTSMTHGSTSDPGRTTTTKGSDVKAEQVTPGTGQGGSHGGGVLAFTGANITTITTLGAAAIAAGTAVVLATNEDELPGQRATLRDAAEDR